MNYIKDNELIISNTTN